MNTIHAVYEKGIFRPTGPVDLPEGTVVSIQSPAASDKVEESRRRVFESLLRSYDGGDPRAAERHNEHQP